MAGFSADWLTLREPADTAARAEAVTAAVIATLRRGDPGEPAPLAVDLGAGTGANRRYLASRLPGDWHWRLVDRDRRLLEAAASGGHHDLELVDADLAAVPLARLLAGAALVTASALLDLVSDAWLASLADACAASRTAVLFALIYDGRVEMTPGDVDDAGIVALVNSHQHRDKGLGPALGPEAAARTAEVFGARGYRTVRGPSDWRLGAEAADLQRALIAGWAQAAVEMRGDDSRAIASWQARRLAHVDAGRSRLVVGHQDLGGLWN